MQKGFLSLLAALILGLASPALAENVRIGALEIESAWARASAGKMMNGAAYVIVRNHGDQPDRLIGVKASVSRMAGLHTTVMEGGVMKMRPIEAVDIPAGGMAMLEPGGNHVMFTELSAPLKEGSMFPLTLVFEKAGEVEVEVTVMAVGAKGGVDHGSMPMEGMKMEAPKTN